MPGLIYGQRTNLMGLYSGEGIGGLIFRRKNTSTCNLSNLLFFLSFFQYKAHISAFFTLSNMWIMFKVDNTDTRIHKANKKAKNKDTDDIVLACLLLTWNMFHFLLHCFYCWLWSVNYWLVLLFVILTLCACWNQFRKSFHSWRNYVNKLH